MTLIFLDEYNMLIRLFRDECNRCLKYKSHIESQYTFASLSLDIENTRVRILMGTSFQFHSEIFWNNKDQFSVKKANKNDVKLPMVLIYNIPINYPFDTNNKRATSRNFYLKSDVASEIHE